jgi:radical SAM protein with 4Fe4S-binding SPASM domain
MDRRLHHRDLGAAAPAQLPVALQVEVTSTCNLRCRMCPLTTGTSSSSQSAGPMHDIVFDALLDIARRVRQVIFAGYGEPLTNPRFLSMLRTLDDEGIATSFATNGLMLNGKVARTLAELRHLTLVNVSIDSPDETVYRSVRGGNLRRALAGVRELVTQIGPERVAVSAVAMDVTLPSIATFPALLASIGVRRFSVQAVHDYTPYAEDQRLLGHHEHRHLLEELHEQCRAHGIVLEVTGDERTRADVDDPAHARARYYGNGAWDPQQTRQCSVPWEIPYVDKDGRVFPCCFAGAANEAQLGDVHDDEFLTIWRGERFGRFRRDLLDGRTTPDICRRCTLAPLGEHVLHQWAGVVVAANLEPATGYVAVTARNAGTQVWTATSRLRVGTSGPRDTPSLLAHESWPDWNRAFEYDGPDVAPGEHATFVFAIERVNNVEQDFELLVEGTCWMDQTRFTISTSTRSTRVLRGIHAAPRVGSVARRLTPPRVRRWLRHRTGPAVRTAARRPLE